MSDDVLSAKIANSTDDEPGNLANDSKAPTEGDEPVVQFRRVGGNKKNVKKRPLETSANDDEDTVQIVKKAKAGSAGLVDEAAIADSGVSALEGTSFGFTYESTGSKRATPADAGITVSNKELEDAEEPQRNSAMPGDKTSADGKLLYTGQAGYTQHVKQSKYSGPVRQTGHVRPDVRMDYARDICKDYKETGYCGYGDTCIFLHDRSDYKAGWQIEREQELELKTKREQKAKTFASGASSSAKSSDPSITDDGLLVSSKDSKELPFACFICRKPFNEPVVTKCGHYFCQSCALTRFATDKSCAVCKEPTGGSFNSALKILKRRDELAKLTGSKN